MDYDDVVRLGFTLFFFLWNIVEGFKIDTHYPKNLVVLYVYPLWRLLILITFVIGALWCDALSMMMAFAIVFYFMDLQLLLYKTD
jgi:hypothetical protein